MDLRTMLDQIEKLSDNYLDGSLGNAEVFRSFLLELLLNNKFADDDEAATIARRLIGGGE